jgi:hypothetical protein
VSRICETTPSKSTAGILEPRYAPSETLFQVAI